MIRLHRVIYLSRAVGPAARELLPLAEILGASQRNNRARGLTGLLLAHDGWFLQVLEGQAEAIERLLADLRGDSRHREIRILSSGPIERPLFPHWSMGQARLTPEIAPLLAGRDLGALTAAEALAVLQACAAGMAVEA